MAAAGFGAGKRFGIWQLPSLYAGASAHQHMPPGGFQSFGQLGQHVSNKVRFQDEDYILQQALQKLGELAENATVAIQNRIKGIADPTSHYDSAYIQGQNIVGLKEQDIISGLYPRLRQEDMERGQEMGVIVGPTNGLFTLRVDVLRRLMEDMEKKAASREFGHQSIGHLSGVADKVSDLATGGGMIGLGKNVNPLSGS